MIIVKGRFSSAFFDCIVISAIAGTGNNNDNVNDNCPRLLTRK